MNEISFSNIGKQGKCSKCGRIGLIAEVSCDPSKIEMNGLEMDFTGGEIKATDQTCDLCFAIDLDARSKPSDSIGTEIARAIAELAKAAANLERRCDTGAGGVADAFDRFKQAKVSLAEVIDRYFRKDGESK